MDDALLCATPSSSLADEDDSLPQRDRSAEELCAATERPASVDGGHYSVISDSMTVTSNDREKLMLLDKNTELRRVNRELMKLNEDWDQVYRNTTMGLQMRLQSLELENKAVKHLTGRLLLKVQQQQASTEYYEHELIQETKKTQELQNHIHMLESQLQQVDNTESTQGDVSAGMYSESIRVPTCPELSCGPTVSGKRTSNRREVSPQRVPEPEVKALKEQLEALRHQTKIYEGEYRSEHKNHKQTKQENQRLRRKREEMGQQVALMQEQLKVYEDDFYRERSDKQVLERLLMKKSQKKKEPVLFHRRNNAEQPYEEDRKTPSNKDY